MAALVAVLVLGVVAVGTLRHLARAVGGNPFTYAKNAVTVPVSVDVAAPEPLKSQVLDFLDALGKRSASAQAGAVQAEFSCVKRVVVRRSWVKRTARLELSLRSPVAVAGKKSYLSDDGVVFDAPEGLYHLTGPAVEPGAAQREHLAAAAAFVQAAVSASPAPLEALKFVSAQDGWEARLADGTVVLWGDGRWTEEKFARLREALADAKTQPDAAAAYAADLRYFEDGKLLLRPMPPRSFSMR